MIKKRSEVQGAQQSNAPPSTAQEQPKPGPSSPPSATPQTQAPQATKPAEAPPRSMQHQGSVSCEGDEVTVCWGPDRYQPVDYNSFEHGPFFVKTKVRAGETYSDAAARAWNAVVVLAKGAYPGKSQEYLENLRKLGIATRS